MIENIDKKLDYKSFIKYDVNGKSLSQSEIFFPNSITKIDYNNSHNSEFYRLNKLNKGFNNRIIYNEFLFEIKRIRQYIPLRIRTFYLVKQSIEFFNKLPKKSKYKNQFYCCGIILFVELRNNFIFINKKDFFKIINCKKKIFYKMLNKFYHIYSKVYKYHKSDIFRIKFMLNIANGLFNHLKINYDYFPFFKKTFLKNFNFIKNRSNEVVIALIMFRIINIKQLTIPKLKVCKFLGVYSGLYNHNIINDFK